ncbi:hypothetical protein KIN20_036408 [Parelaphostrongylus tenuis]|uniref:Amidohydrolase-related domain-containing protein n=1 Tax=Parelaphostrongylus tenuis TaxID=148309 RepID=A0AAD5RD46_PARTN|nr:hypothetical protein KIN20_036408 [Parelaphostrongylus tenuis]
MFPFLAPIQTSRRRRTLELHSECLVNVQFYTEIPELSGEIMGTLLHRPSSGNKLNVRSRPVSRNKSRSPHGLAQPTLARSTKSSPIPFAPSDVPPQPSRHRNKGLETSSAMRELFGGGGSSFGATSAFDRIPQSQEARNFHRKNVIEKEFQQFSDWEVVKCPPAKAPFFTEIEDHNTVYERARKRGNWRSTTSHFDQIAQPGPELFEDTNQTTLEQQEDVVTSETSNEIQREPGNLGNDNWNEFDDTVVSDAISNKETQRMMDSEPGPDIGDDEELSSGAGDTNSDAAMEQSANERGDGDTRAVSDGESAAAGVGDAEESCSGQQARAGVGGGGGGGMSLVIRGAQVVNDDSVFFADVLVQDGVIRNVGSSLEVPADAEVLEAAGKMLLPAGIDVYTYFTVHDSADDLTTSCKAAIAGGTATVIDVVSPKAGESLSSSLSRAKDGLSSSLCNVGFSIVVQHWSDSVRKEMEKVAAEGVNSFIIDVEGDNVLYQILEHCRALGVLARVLPENRTIVPYLEKKMLELGISGPEGFLQSRPEELESEYVSRLCVLSQLSNCPVSILSVSSSESVSAVERARCSGALAYVEIASAAVVADGTHYFNKCLKHAATHMTEVPLRTEGCSKLVSALASQSLAVCASGHHAISSDNRLGGRDFTAMPKGTVGVEERMCAVWEKAVRTGRIDPMRFVAVTSTNAAKMFNLYPRKGRIAVGADADLVLWDASGRWKLSSAERQSSVDISIYEGMTVHAQVSTTTFQLYSLWSIE